MELFELSLYLDRHNPMSQDLFNLITEQYYGVMEQKVLEEKDNTTLYLLSIPVAKWEHSIWVGDK